MTYQNPQLLFGLLAIAIPILIHLFNFRKHETVYFSSIRFLKEIKTKNNKKRNIRNLLILLSRIAAIIFLVLAFAKPYIPIEENKVISNDIFIYIDNSFSMDGISEKGRLLDLAKNNAINITDSYSAASKFHLITNDFSKKHNKGYDKQDLIEAISNIETSGDYKSFSQILKKKQTISNKEDHLYIISDLQKNTLKIEEENEENKNRIFFVPILNQIKSNISIDSIWIESPVLISSRNLKISTKISNFSNLNKEVPFSLEVNNKTKIKQILKIKKNSSKNFEFNIAIDSTINICKASIEDYPITFDNSLNFNLNSMNKIKILNIQQDLRADYINNLYSNDSINFSYKNANINKLNYQEIKTQNLIILNEIEEISSGLTSAIINFVENGGSIIIIPPADINYNEYKNFLTELETDYFLDIDTNNYLIKNIQLEHPIFNNVFAGEINNINYPEIKYHYSQTRLLKTNKKSLYTLENNNTFLSHYNIKNGNIYMFNSPLNSKISIFKKHALFVPTFLNIATSAITQGNLYYTISKDNYFISNKEKNNEIYHLKNLVTDIVPTIRTINGQSRFYTNNQIFKSGQYQLYNNKEITDHIAYNYNTVESDNNYYKISEIKKLFKNNNIMIINGFESDINQIIDSKLNDNHFWKLCLILSLIFFGIEILLLKLIKI